MISYQISTLFLNSKFTKEKIKGLKGKGKNKKLFTLIKQKNINCFSLRSLWFTFEFSVVF